MNQKNHIIVKVGLSVVVILGSLGLGYFLGLRKASSASEENQLYAIVDGQKIWGRDVLPRMKDQLHELERSIYELKKRAVHDFIEEKNQSKAGAAGNPSEPEFTQKEFDQYLRERNLNLSRLKEKARQDILNNFKIHKAMLARKAKLESDLIQNPISWYIPIKHLGEPLEVGPGSLPEIGSGSKGSIVVFGNYHCAHCAQIPKKLKDLQEKYKNELDVHFRFSMIDSEKAVAFQTAMAAICASEQKEFLPFHHALFEAPPVSPEALVPFVEKQGLDMERFKDCFKSKKVRELIADDQKFASEHGFNGDAVAFVNGYRIPIQEPLETFEAVLNQE